jgi:hypothetical protein
VVIAFFEVSELPLIPFIAKLIKTYFFDTTKKFQINYEKPDATQIVIKEAASQEKKQIIEYKTDSNVTQETLESIEK